MHQALPSTLTAAPKTLPPAIAVIFGASGDLTHRKIVPAFYHLAKNGQLPEDFAIVGFARRDWTHEQFRQGLKEALDQFSHTKPVVEEVWAKMEPHIYYFKGDLPEVESYNQLAKFLRELPEHEKIGDNYLFYLSVSPNFFGPTAKNLAAAGLARGEEGEIRRLVVEKPFGTDLDSAIELNNDLQSAFPERSIYRIDHYLGKETVQNLLYFRFANSIYEPLWNRRYIDHVQITVAEKVGVLGRGGYYEHAGASRDMLQNHMFQLLTLTAMEPPASLDGESVRDEKVKVLKSIIPPAPEVLGKQAIRAQYGGGFVDGEGIPAYRQEERVAHDSLTETYVALKLQVDNWRWNGVPFYLRTGKALAAHYTEINIVYKAPPSVLFAKAAAADHLSRNSLRIRIQPNEGITLGFNAKKPSKSEPQKVQMDFAYKSGFQDYLPEAYERLIIDALIGESTLFTRSDEVEEAWRIVDAVHDCWDAQNASALPLYASGSMGPVEADLLLEKDGRHWIAPDNV